MFHIIDNFKNLYVADFSKGNNTKIKLVYSKNDNFVVDGVIIYPFAIEVKTDTSVLLNNSNHVKKLKYYVNCFGFPRKYILDRDKEKQKLVVNEIKLLKKMRKI